MIRRALGSSVLCFLFVYQAGAQGNSGHTTDSYVAGWGGGPLGRPWFESPWRPQYPNRIDPKWLGYSGDPVWAYDAMEAKPQAQPPQILVVVLPGQASQPPAVEPPAPARAEVHEYEWPDSGRPETETFSISLKGGTILAATLVCVQEDSILYVAPDGRLGRIPFESIDSDAIRNLKAKKDLRVSLPRNQAGD